MSSKIYTRVGWNSNVAILALVIILLLQAQPLLAQEPAPEPMPNQLTAMFFYDTDSDGELDANESMAPGFDLTFKETHADGTESSFTARSDSNGYFNTTMQPCPCTWSLRANGDAFTGSVETWTGKVYVRVAIERHNLYLPIVAKG